MYLTQLHKKQKIKSTQLPTVFFGIISVLFKVKMKEKDEQNYIE